MQKESFGIDASACGGALQPGDECIVNVAFTADTLEPRSATAVLFASGAREKRLTTEPAIPCSSGCRLLASGGVSMLATPTKGASSYFTGWTSSDAQEPGCTGSVRECRANIDTNQTITANFGELDNNLIFVSSETFAADLGGTAPYDAACNRLATEAGINDPSGTGYIAAISGAEALSVRVPANVRGWIRMDGLPVADTLAGLLATNTAGPFYPVLLDELGQSHASFEYVMTGTGEDGSLANNRDDWTPGSADSTLLLSPTGVTWGDIAGSCDRPASLLCMGVTKTAPLIAQTYTGKRLWTTATALTVVLLRAVIMRAPILILALLCGCSIDDRAPTVSPGSSGNSSAPGSNISMVADGASIDRAAAAAGAGGLVPGSVLVTDVDVIDFGDSVSGQTFTRPLRVRNAGDTQASGFGATLDGPQRQAFGIETSDCGDALAPGAECIVIVTFTPDAPGSRSATAIVTASGAQEKRIRLSGAGVAAGSLTTSRAQLDFETREAGVNSEGLQWAVTNTGGTPTGSLTLTNGDPMTFSTTTDCGPPLAPGASCNVVAQFVGQRRAITSTLVTITDGSNTAQTQLSVRAIPGLTIQINGSGSVQITSDPAVPCETGCRLLVDRTVSLLATPTNGSSSYFTGWTSSTPEEPGCTGRLRECDAYTYVNETLTANFTELANNLIFVSSETFTATLGGSAPYDAACNRLATAAGINDASGAGYVAAVSGTAPFVDRIPAIARGWIRMDGMPFADTLQSLFDTNDPAPFYPVLLDEWGSPSLDLVWTGTSENGVVANNCDSWTPGSDDYGVLGIPTSVTWTGNAGQGCTASNPVYCMGITKSAPVVPQPYTGQRVWTTATTLSVGNQSPDAFCQASRPAGVVNAAALIASTTRAGGTLLDLEATYVRPDGALVGTGAQLLVGLLTTPLSIANDGSQLTSLDDVWTGGPLRSMSVAEANCNDWTDPASSAAFGDPTDTSSRGFLVANEPCTEPKRVYCVEL